MVHRPDTHGIDSLNKGVVTDLILCYHYIVVKNTKHFQGGQYDKRKIGAVVRQAD